MRHVLDRLDDYASGWSTAALIIIIVGAIALVLVLQ